MMIVVWFVYTMMMMIHRGAPPSTTPPINYINHHGYPCWEMPYPYGDWLFIVQYPNDIDEDMIPSYGLVRFDRINGLGYGVYVNNEGCVLS